MSRGAAGGAGRERRGGRILGHADIRRRRRQQEVKEEILTLSSWKPEE